MRNTSLLNLRKRFFFLIPAFTKVEKKCLLKNEMTPPKWVMEVSVQVGCEGMSDTPRTTDLP